jgi:Rieske Fe-S protein
VTLNGKTRREFCEGSWRFATLAALGGLGVAGAGCDNVEGPRLPNVPTKLVVLTGTLGAGGKALTIARDPTFRPQGSAALVQAGPVSLLVAVALDGIVALDAHCTYAECVIGEYLPYRYYCQCHGCQFSVKGEIYRGPASAPLRQYTVEVDTTLLTIRL